MTTLTDISPLVEGVTPNATPYNYETFEEIDNERDALWEEHLETAIDNDKIQIMLTEAPCNPFVLKVNHKVACSARIGEPVSMTSEQVMALAAVSGVNFKYV